MWMGRLQKHWIKLHHIFIEWTTIYHLEESNPNKVKYEEAVMKKRKGSIDYEKNKSI